MKRQHLTLLSSASYPRLSITCLHQRMGARGSGLQRPGKEGSRLAEPPAPWSPHSARREATLINKRLPRHPSGFPCELVEGSVPSKVMNGKKTRGQKSPRLSGRGCLYKGRKQPQRAPQAVAGVSYRPQHSSRISAQPGICHRRLGTGAHSEDEQEAGA